MADRDSAPFRPYVIGFAVCALAQDLGGPDAVRAIAGAATVAIITWAIWPRRR